MKNQTVKTVLIVALTATVTVIAFILLMPIIGPRFMHPLMSVYMPMHANSAAPVDLDTSTVRTTDNGLYRISFTSELDPPAINQIHTWTLHIETVDGQPVEDAEVTVDGGMPQHGHGLSTRPQVTQNLGNGDYLVEGMKFQMGGWWEVRFVINAGGQSDTVTFNLILEG